MADSDRNLLVGDQIFENDFSSFVFETCTAFVTIELLDLFELFDDHVPQFFLGAKD
jgi:hypothetical protein